jgi:hypothetical protein
VFDRANRGITLIEANSSQPGLHRKAAERSAALEG